MNVSLELMQKHIRKDVERGLHGDDLGLLEFASLPLHCPA